MASARMTIAIEWPEGGVMKYENCDRVTVHENWFSFWHEVEGIRLQSFVSPHHARMIEIRRDIDG